MNTIELARKAGMRVGTNLSGVTLVGSPSGDTIAHLTIDDLERFAALVLEEHLKGVDMEPAAWNVYRAMQDTALEFSRPSKDSDYLDAVPFYTATQMAAVRHRALEEHLKGVDVEPVAWLDLSKMTHSVMVYATGFKATDEQSQLYTAEQMAAVRHRALDEAAQICEKHAESDQGGEGDLQSASQKRTPAGVDEPQ